MTGCGCAELGQLALRLDHMITGLRAQIMIEAKRLAEEMAKPMIEAAERGAQLRIAEADHRVQRLEDEVEELHRAAWAQKRRDEGSFNRKIGEEASVG